MKLTKQSKRNKQRTTNNNKQSKQRHKHVKIGYFSLGTIVSESSPNKFNSLPVTVTVADPFYREMVILNTTQAKHILSF